MSKPSEDSLERVLTSKITAKDFARMKKVLEGNKVQFMDGLRSKFETDGALPYDQYALIGAAFTWLHEKTEKNINLHYQGEVDMDSRYGENHISLVIGSRMTKTRVTEQGLDKTSLTFAKVNPSNIEGQNTKFQLLIDDEPYVLEREQRTVQNVSPEGISQMAGKLKRLVDDDGHEYGFVSKNVIYLGVDVFADNPTSKAEMGKGLFRMLIQAAKHLNFVFVEVAKPETVAAITMKGKMTTVADLTSQTQRLINEAESRIQSLSADIASAVSQREQNNIVMEGLRSGKGGYSLEKSTKDFGLLLSRKFYESFEVDERDGNCLKVIGTTVPVMVTHVDGRKYPMGRYRVSMTVKPGQPMSPSYINVTGEKLLRDAYWHPHIRKGGEVCFGSMATSLATLCGQNRIAQVFENVFFFLQTWNNRDSYASLEDWFIETKYTCGTCKHRFGDCPEGKAECKTKAVSLGEPKAIPATAFTAPTARVEVAA